jgi:hypothetical protein
LIYIDRNRFAPPEINVLNFALGLEHLETSFYSGLNKFTQKDFTDAGFPAGAFGRYQEVFEHESTHVKVLSDAIGDGAVQPCEYSL